MADSAPDIDPRHSVLLVMDYQVGILDRLSDADALLRRANDAISMARACGMQIGYVRVAFDDADYDVMPETNKTFGAVAAGRLMHHGAPDTAIHDDVVPKAGDIIVRKTRVGAFSTTDLDRQLRDREIDTLILAGISTSGVVLSTVRDAADRDYRVYVLANASADPDPETHEFLIGKVFPRQAYVVSIAELSELLPSR